MLTCAQGEEIWFKDVFEMRVDCLNGVLPPWEAPKVSVMGCFTCLWECFAASFLLIGPHGNATYHVSLSQYCFPVDGLELLDTYCRYYSTNQYSLTHSETMLVWLIKKYDVPFSPKCISLPNLKLTTGFKPKLYFSFELNVYWCGTTGSVERLLCFSI